MAYDNGETVVITQPFYARDDGQAFFCQHLEVGNFMALHFLQRKTVLQDAKSI